MKLGHIELFVGDPLRAQQFYQDILGFELVAVQQEQFVWLKLDQQEILLRPGQTVQKSQDYEAAAIGFVLYTDDLDKTAQELEARGLVFKTRPGRAQCYTFTRAVQF